MYIIYSNSNKRVDLGVSYELQHVV